DSNLRSELRRRQRLFQEVLDSIATPILQISYEPSRILFVNKATVDKLGFSRQVLMGSDPGLLFSSNEEMMQMLDQRGSFLADISMMDAHGMRRYMEVKAQFIEDEGDSRFIVNLHDVTERQELMEAQEYSLQQLQEAQRMAKVGSWRYDVGSEMPLFSPEALALHGLDGSSPLSAEEYVDLVPWEERQEIKSWLQDMLSGSKPYPLRYTIRGWDGVPRYFVMHAEQIRDAEGIVVGLTGTSQDISEIELLQQKNTLYLQTFDMMNVEMVYFSEEGRIVECNRSFARKRGYPKDSLKGRFVSILNPRYTEESWPRFWQRITRQGSERREDIHRRDDGSDYDVLVSLNLMDYLGQKMVLAMITDITELKTYQKQLQRSLKEKTALLQEVHHRVGNNLQTISSFVSLKSMHSPSEEVQLYLEDVNDRIMSIAAIHNSMYEQERFLDLELLQHLRTVWNNSFQIIHGGHDIDISGDPVFIDINRALPLSLVVSELLSNSLHHAFKGRKGRMELRLEDQDGSLLIHYNDDGGGYSDENLKGGQGKVGLNLMRNLVERQLKGSIRFYNQNGANAEIVLPKGFFNRSIRDPLSDGDGQ
ncbi:MAG: PAS domain S-box protein, partial [Candidatus Methanomethylophilaceae archaeon]